MQDQGKRLLLAVGLALVVLLGYNMIFPSPRMSRRTAKVPGAGSATPELVATVSNLGPRAKAADDPLLHGPRPAPRGNDAQRARAEAHRLRRASSSTFTSYGGAIKSWRLTDPRYAKVKDRDQGRARPRFHKQFPDAADVRHQLRHDDDGVLIPPHATGRASARSTTPRSSTRCRRPSSTSTKTFTIEPEDYMVKLSVADDHDDRPRARRPTRRSRWSATSSRIRRRRTRAGSVRACRACGTSVHASSYEDGKVHNDGRDGDQDRGPIRRRPTRCRAWRSNVQWTGFEHPYLLVGFAPHPLNPTRTSRSTRARSSRRA